MWISSRRIALVSASGLLLVVTGAGLAWLTDRWPVQVSEAETGTLADASDDAIAWPAATSDGPSGDFALTSFAEPDVPSDEAPAEPSGVVSFHQSEPEAGSGSRVAEASGPGEFANHGQLLTEIVPAQSVPLGQAIAGDDSGNSLSMPAQFPDRQSRSKPRIAANAPASDTRMALDARGTQDARSTSGSARSTLSSPPQVVRQTGFTETSSTSNVRDRADVFGSDQPLSVRQSREFPSEVQVVPPRGRAAADPERLFAQGEQPVITPATEASGTDSSAAVPLVARGEGAPAGTPAPIGATTALPSLDAIDAALKAGDLVAAHRDLSQLYWHQPEQRAALRERINQTATTIYFSPAPHFLEPHTVAAGELMQSIAPKYQISWQYLAMLNRIDPRRLQAGKKLKVVKGPFSAFIDLSDFELTIHHHGFFVRRYSVCTGKDGATPTGRFKVLDKIPKPQYTDPDGKVLAGGDPLNPLGTHWIDLGDSYGIHGTIDPASIGKAESRGCVRLLNEEVAEVYSFLIKGSEVVIRP